MDPRRWQQTARICEEARSLPTGVRAAFLARACGDDEALRREVDSLLAVEVEAVALLDEPLLSEPDWIGRHIGPYCLKRELGRGGMGIVYLAEQAPPHHREVAVKLVSNHRPTPLQQQRFALEQAILGRLNHSAVAKLYQSGLTANGAAYFVMEYVSGEPITTFCDTHRFDVRRRLALMIKVCEAMAHVHLKGVVHRDLKPSNILVQAEGETAQPKIIDFGIAKDAVGPESLTREGAVPGTLRYMSPEQAGLSGPDGHSLACDFRTDVYALGAVLYEMLVGRPPLTWEVGSSYAKAVRVICEQQPAFTDEAWRAHPQEQRRALAERRGLSVAAVRAELGGDLRWILARALAKQPEDRYQSPRDLAQDLYRLCHNLPVEARRSSLPYVFGKFVKRNKAAAAAVATTAALVPVFMVLLFMQQQQTALERDRARDERDAAETITEFLVSLFQAKDPYKKHNGELSVAALMQTSSDQIDRRLEKQPHLRSRLLGTMGRVYHNLGMVQEGRTRLEQALQDRSEVGEKAPEVLANNLKYLAQLDQETGRYQQAEAGLDAAAALLVSRFGPEHLGYLEVRNMMGHLLFEQGQFEKAEPLLVETLAALRGVAEVDRLKIGRTLNNLAVLKQRQAKFDQAETYFRDSLDLHREVYGDVHPLIAILRNNLAAIYFKRGEYDLAEQHYQASLQIKRKRLGDDHPSIANSLNNLAVLHQEQGKWAEAADELCRSIAIRERHTDQITLTLAQGYINLGWNQTLLERRREARANLTLALAMIRTTFGADHPQIPYALNNLARNEAEAGETERATALFHEALNLALFHQRTSDLFTATLAANLADTLSRQGAHQDALYYAESAVGMLEATGHGGHWMRYQTQVFQGNALTGLGRFDEAGSLLNEALVFLSAQFGVDHWKTKRAQKALARWRLQKPAGRRAQMELGPSVNQPR